MPKDDRQPATRRGQSQVDYVADSLFIDPPFPLHLYSHLLQLHVETADRAFLLKEVVDLDGVREAIADGNEKATHRCRHTI
ncbi:MAG: hypothetical protein JSV81_01940 [Anaerolineales bacterium]|nr:MAG: hypothetical protein JSV81_01940 [Anaerolineales bacterium]